jgi:hypothetical protein
MECLNKSEHKQIKSLLGKMKVALYYSRGEDYNNNPKKATFTSDTAFKRFTSDTSVKRE